jgi:hypothetical protein
MIEIKVEYQGVSIEYVEYSNRWHNVETGKDYESFIKAKESIDRAIKANEKVDPIKVIRKSEDRGNNGKGYCHAEIMSFSSKDAIWIRDEGKKGRGEIVRIPTYAKELFMDTPDNWEKISQIRELQEKSR